ncbi:hypothetical protein BDZ45DRAFT_502211 [Acephala macrosclerotiorum]|nr:hypothetical protein BDZ45DRAFT_502211 [Acephala macrosclerotiorum]
MLPDILTGSYQRYKNDTNVFTTWLAKTAASCGYKAPKSARKEQPPPPTPSPPTPRAAAPKSTLTLAEKLRAQAEEKAKKAAKKKEEKRNPTATNAAAADTEPEPLSTTKHYVRTRDLLRQAEIVSKNAKVKIPDTIVQVVERAIKARRRCADWFASTGVENGHSTEGHLHFIEILEQAVGILKPSSGNTAAEAPKTTPKPQPKPKLRPETHNFNGLSNRFSNLEVEELEDIADASATIQVLNIGSKLVPKSKAPPPKNVDVYELETDNAYDKGFDVFCFFEDLHRIQDFLADTWGSYKEGVIDLMTATLVTNSAFDIVRREEEQLTWFLYGHRDLSYGLLSSLVFYPEVFDMNMSVDDMIKASLSLQVTPFDNFIYLPTARSLMKFETFAKIKAAFPQPVTHAHMSYMFDQNMLNQPEVQKMEAEDTFLCQYMMEMTFNDMTATAGVQFKMGITKPDMNYPVEGLAKDEFTRGFYNLTKRREISSWFVFACRILVDIQEILGPHHVRRGWEQFHRDSVYAKENLHARTHPNGALKIQGERWRTNWGVDEITKIYEECSWIEKNVYEKMKNSWLDKCLKNRKPLKFYHSAEELRAVHPHTSECMPEPICVGRTEYMPLELRNAVESSSSRKMIDEHKEIPPNREDTFLYARNLFLSGFKAFELACLVETAGTCLANHHQAIFCVAHLYNAALQTGCSKTRWEELDHIIETHMGTIFAGALPIGEKECFMRFELQFGFSIKKNARDLCVQESRRLRPGMKKGPELKDTKMSTIFRQSLAKKKSLQQSLNQLEDLIQEEHSAGKPKSKAMTRYRPQLTPLQLLGYLQDYLPKAIKAMRIDYISMVRKCNVVLKTIRKEIKIRMAVQGFDASQGPEGNSNDPQLIVMVQKILEESSINAGVQEGEWRQILKAAGAAKVKGGPQMFIVGDVLDEILPDIIKDEDGKKRREKAMKDSGVTHTKTADKKFEAKSEEPKTVDADQDRLSMVERLKLANKVKAALASL